jgi:hypothetical protein
VIQDGKCVIEVAEEVWQVRREYEARGREPDRNVEEDGIVGEDGEGLADQEGGEGRMEGTRGTGKGEGIALGGWSRVQFLGIHLRVAPESACAVDWAELSPSSRISSPRCPLIPPASTFRRG